MEALSSWSEDMLRLDTSTLTRLMKMGDKVRALLPRAPVGRQARLTMATPVPIPRWPIR